MMNGYYDPADYDGLTDEEIAANVERHGKR